MNNRRAGNAAASPGGRQTTRQSEPATSRGETQTRDRSGLLPPLSLPIGGGALRGIGDTLSVNPATGTASLSVPLVVANGRPGFALELQLRYDSAAGNGPFGIGWQLSTPSQ